jgi:hypothetical protein
MPLLNRSTDQSKSTSPEIRKFRAGSHALLLERAGNTQQKQQSDDGKQILVIEKTNNLLNHG